MNKRHHKFLIIALSLAVAVCFCSAQGDAATSVAKAKAAYSKAMIAEQNAKAAWDSVSGPYKLGAYGFYQWVSDNFSDWRRADAQEAMQVLDYTAFKKYTKRGNEEDATDLKNMKRAVKLYPTLAAKRANDVYHANLQPPTIRNVYIARAQVNANASAFTYNHMGNDSGCDLGTACENLAWGYDDPFEGWYDEELVCYTKVRNYTINKYGLDPGTVEWDRYINQESFDYNAYLKAISKFGEIGHYCNVCMEGTSVTNFDKDPSDPEYITFERAGHVFFGLAFSQYGACHCLEADTDFCSYSEGYSVAEFTDMFNQYFNAVYPAAEDAAYKDAKKSASSALSALKSAAKPKKPTKAKRSKKKVTVTWKAVKGVDGYQISASPKKGGTKIVAKVGKKTKKKTVKVSKAKKQYVKVRSYVKVNGTIVYSNWSPARRTN